MSVTGTLVTDEVNVTVAGMKLQLLFGGRLMQIEGDKEPDPVNPFCAVNVRVVVPDWPGLAILITEGFAVIPKPSPTATMNAGEVAPKKFASPLYCAVMLFGPSGT